MRRTFGSLNIGSDLAYLMPNAHIRRQSYAASILWERSRPIFTQHSRALSVIE